MRITDQSGKSLTALADQATFVHNQTASASVWTIQHNLGKVPSCWAVESTGVRIFGNEQVVDLNTLQITFNVAITGKAYLN